MEDIDKCIEDCGKLKNTRILLKERQKNIIIFLALLFLSFYLSYWAFDIELGSIFAFVFLVAPTTFIAFVYYSKIKRNSYLIKKIALASYDGSNENEMAIAGNRLSKDETENQYETKDGVFDPLLQVPSATSLQTTLVWPKIWGIYFILYWVYVNIRWGLEIENIFSLAIYVVLTVGIFMSYRACFVLLAVSVASELVARIGVYGIQISNIYYVLAVYMIIQGTIAMFRLHKSKIGANKTIQNGAKRQHR